MRTRIRSWLWAAVFIACCSSLPLNAATRTAKGTAASKSLPASTAWTPLTGISIANAASVIVIVAVSNGGAPSTLTWNGTSLAKDVGAADTNAAPTNTSIWSVHNVTGGTGSLVLNQASSNWSAFSAAAVTVIEVTGLLATSTLDQTAAGNSASSTWTAPATSVTATTTQADEFLVGGHGNRGPTTDTDVTTNNGDTTTKGQQAGTSGSGATSNVTLDEMFATVSATGTFKHSWSGMTARSGSAVIATYKIDTSFVPPANKRLTTLGAGER